jgi:glycosyltransferase involved in cell wall biosynthesis
VTSNSDLDQDLDVPLGQPVDVDGVSVWYFARQEFFKRWLPFVPYLSKSMGYLYSPQIRPVLDRLTPNADIIHTHMPYVYPSYAAARAAFRYGKPLIYHQHGVFDPERLRFRGLKKRLYIAAVERPIMQRANTLIAETTAAEESYRALGVTTRIAIVPNGVEVPRVPHTVSLDFERRWGIPPQAPMILFLGRVHPIKGADRLLDAFLEVHPRIPEAVLVIAGPDEWGVEAQFRKRVAQAGLEGRVVFPGMVTGQTKLDFLSRANLFCLPSSAEGFAMAVLEALASATPVLISPRCHFPEVEQAGAGRVVPPDTGSIGAALVQLLGDASKLSAMGRAGRQLVAAHYSWDEITRQYLAIYERAIAEQR